MTSDPSSRSALQVALLLAISCAINGLEPEVDHTEGGRYPSHWWEQVPESDKAWWEILPQAAGPGEVILQAQRARPALQLRRYALFVSRPTLREPRRTLAVHEVPGGSRRSARSVSGDSGGSTPAAARLGSGVPDKSTGRANAAKLWPDNTVFYEIAEDLPDYSSTLGVQVTSPTEQVLTGD